MNINGKQLIGYYIEKWVDSKNGRFLAKGIIIDYNKFNKQGKLGYKNGQYLIQYKNGKKYWSRRCDFTLIEKYIQI